MLSSAKFLNGINSIANRSFYDCTNLKSITLGTGLTSIGSFAFYQCKSLTTVGIPADYNKLNMAANELNSIGESAFAFCSSLESIIIPSGINYICPRIFDSCSKLSYVRYLGLTSPEYYYTNLLEGCNVDKVFVPPNYMDESFCGCKIETFVITNTPSLTVSSSITKTIPITKTSDFTEPTIITKVTFTNDFTQSPDNQNNDTKNITIGQIAVIVCCCVTTIVVIVGVIIIIKYKNKQIPNIESSFKSSLLNDNTTNLDLHM